MYYLKYYAEIQNFRGQFSRVEIHQAGTRPQTVLQIGDVCGLDLEIQGSQDDVFTPIIKTQAHLSMISSDDKPTEQGIKYGGWGEFFTPDATLYKMLIKTRATEQDPWTTRWTGYITPDSWQEDLGYRTPVTITARDNIGHLQDFEFDFDNYDKYGLASIRSIITAGMNLIELPMTLDMNSAPANFQAAGTDVLDAMVMCRHFEGKDWYSVIESLLDAIGYTLRYTDNNRVTLAPIRYLPNGGRGTGGDNRSNAVPVQFYDGNGVVVPAVKSIIEDHNYDYLGEVEIPIRSSDINYGTEGSYKAYVKWTNTRPGMEGKDAPVYSIVDGGSTNWLPGSDLYKTDDPSLLTLDREGGSWDDYIFLAANGKRYTDAEGKRKQALQFTTRTPNVTLRAKFNSNPLSVLQDIVVPEDPEYEEEIKGGFVLENIGLYTFEFKIKYESNGETVYWDDTAGWVTEEVTNTRTFEPSSMTTDVEIQLESASGMEGHGVMTFYFENIQYETSGISSLIVACHGVYARLSSFTIEPNAINLSKNTVKTNSDERYNVILRRNPEVSPLSRDVLFALPGNYETGLFYYPSGSNFPEQYPYSGNWSNLNTSATKPLPVIIHQQILAFRGGVLWELSGECAPIDGGILFANQLVRYKDRVYLITSGTIDFYGSGNLLSAVLREYVDYDDIWDDTEQGDWSGDGEYNTIGGETASGSGHSGSSGGGGGSATNFFELDGNGGVKLKDRYDGLSAKGFITAGGMGSTSEEGGADLAAVWVSLRTNEDDFANEKIHPGHLPPLSWSMITSGKPDTLAGYGILNAYTKTEVDNLIGAIDQFHYEIYPSLASITSPASNVLYLIGPTGTGSDKYEEYVYANSTFTKIGDTTIDLSPYLTISSAQATYQPIISDLATIRSRSDEGHTAYGWGDHSQVGYLLATTAAQTYQTIIGDLSTIRSRADEGHTAYGWGNHANAGYFAASSFTAANIVSTLGTTAVNRATADANGNNIANTYATVTALNNVSNRVSTLEGRTNWDNYFGIDASGNIYVKMKDANTARNFYGYGAVTAGGGGSSSGGGGGSVDLDRVWQSLTNNTDKPNVEINIAHIPDLSISKVTGLQTALNGKADASSLNDYVSLTGNQTITGAKTFTQNVISQGSVYLTTTASYSAAPGYISAGGGYSPYSGKYGVRIIACDQSDIQSGLGQDCIGDLPYDFSVIGGKSGSSGTISFVFHDTESTSYTRVGRFNQYGDLYVARDITASGSLNATTIYQNGVALGARAFDSTSYLPLSGGTINGSLGVSGNLTVSESAYFGSTSSCDIWCNRPSTNYFNAVSGGSFAFRPDGGNDIVFSIGSSGVSIYGTLGVTSTTLVSNLNADLLDGQHGSYYAAASSLNNYLPLSGGTLENSAGNILNLNATSGSNCWQYFIVSGTHKASVGYYDGIAFVANETGYHRIGVLDDGTPVYRPGSGAASAGNYTLWHAGNSNLSTTPWSCSSLHAYGTSYIDGLLCFNTYSSIGRGSSLTSGLSATDIAIQAYDGTDYSKIVFYGSEVKISTGSFKCTNIISSAVSSTTSLSTIPSASAILLQTGSGGASDGSVWLWRTNWSSSNYGVFFDDVNDELIFVGGGVSRFAVNLTSGRVGVNNNLSVGGNATISGSTYSYGTIGTQGNIYIDCDAGSSRPYYISAGGGYSPYSGKYGVRIIACDQSDIQSGLGQDCIGDLPYDFSVIGGKSGSSGYISFVFHNANSTSYNRAGYFNQYGDLYVTRDITASGGLYISGATTLTGSLTVNNTASISGNTTIGGTLTVTGSAYLDSTVRIGGSSGATLFYESAYNGLKSDKGIYSLNYMTAGGVNASSDQRQKSNISRVSGADAIAVIMALKPSEWVWNEKHYQNGQKGAGLIAQDVQGVLPFAVSHETEYLSLNYNVFHAYEMAGLQDHETRIKKLEREGREKDMKIASLSTECRELRRQIAQLTS